MSATRTSATIEPPVMEAFGWLNGLSLPPDRPLINVSQAAPVAAPTEGLRQAIATAVMEETSAHLYGPVLGNPPLRAALADRWQRLYGGEIDQAQVAITAGCNQAFAAAIHALTGEGDAVLLPVPWYFNHRMWLDMAGVDAVPLPTGDDLLPDPEQAAGLITDRTRAIVLVSPNNPGGVEYPAELIRAFFELARSRGIRLILDETYRDFHSSPDAPHALFADPDWDDTLVQLYSFSKAYRLTGHRVGAITASRSFLSEVEKFLDTVAISAPQTGQIGALWGIEHLDQWLAGERDEILDRRAAIAEGMPRLEARGWRLVGLGAYFAYLRHPFDLSSPDLARKLLREAGVLMLPGTMFRPDDDPAGALELRVAFANLDREGIGRMFDRLESFRI